MHAEEPPCYADPGEEGLSSWEGTRCGWRGMNGGRCSTLLPGVTCHRSTNRPVSIPSRSCPWTTSSPATRQCSAPVCLPACLRPRNLLASTDRSVYPSWRLSPRYIAVSPRQQYVQWRINGEPVKDSRKYLKIKRFKERYSLKTSPGLPGILRYYSEKY